MFFLGGKLFEIQICEVVDQSRVDLVETGGEAHLSACSYLYIAQFWVAQKMHEWKLLCETTNSP